MHFEILRAAFAALLLASCVQSSQLEKRKCLPANINAATRNMIQQKRFDGYEADPYDDGTGRITVGYGHMCSSETCSELPYKMPISKTDAQALFDSDMQNGLVYMNNKLANNVVLNENQYGALASFVFNMNHKSFRTSTFLKRLNNGEDPTKVISEEFPKFVKGGRPPQPLPGLVDRRQAEIDLAKTPSTVNEYPCDKDADGDPNDPDEGSE